MIPDQGCLERPIHAISASMPSVERAAGPAVQLRVTNGPNRGGTHCHLNQPPGRTDLALLQALIAVFDRASSPTFTASPAPLRSDPTPPRPTPTVRHSRKAPCLHARDS